MSGAACHFDDSAMSCAACMGAWGLGLQWWVAEVKRCVVIPALYSTFVPVLDAPQVPVLATLSLFCLGGGYLSGPGW